MTAKIAYIFPSRSRTIKFFNTLDNIRAMSNSDNYFVWSKLDTDDETMNRPDIIKHLADNYPEVTVKWGTSNNKVHAVNRDLDDLPECDILILQSDDIVWDVKGFDDEIRNAFATHSPDFSHAIHFPDDHGKSRTMIVSILGVNLYRRLGYIYYEGYESVYADDDFTAMTRKMKCHTFIDKRLFSHKHPIWGLEKWDRQYRHSERPEVYKRDREIFIKRQANNFES